MALPFLINRKSKEEKQAYSDQSALANLFKEQSKQSFDLGSSMFPKATASWDNYGETLQGLLAPGGNDKSRAFVSPMLSEISEANAGKERSVSEFGARGGRRSEMMGELSDSESTAVDNILANFRLHALDALPTVGDRYANLGTAVMGGGTAQGAQAGNLLGNLLGYNQRNREFNVQMVNDMMKSAGMMAGGA
jgi:hypothetical protein